MAQTRASSRTADRHSFSDVPPPRVQRSLFDRSSGLHTAFDAGKLVPIFRDELLPGDTVRLTPTVFARFTTLQVPLFSTLNIDLHFYAVPLRLIWENAEEFFGAEPLGPGTRVERQTPKLDMSGGVAEDGLYDYLGIPPGVVDAASARWPNNFYGRACNLIYNTWYRHPELEAPLVVDMDDGPDNPADYETLNRRMKRWDYFTQANLSPFKGPDVTVPLGTSAPVSGTITGAGSPVFVGATSAAIGNLIESGGAIGDVALTGGGAFTNLETLNWNTPNLFLTGATADLSSATGPTVNDYRLAFATQHVFEAFARGGTARYTELLMSTHGVFSPDARLQRPEFLGGTSVQMNTNPVAATVAAGTAVADLAAFAVGARRGRGFSYSSTEHQVLIGFASLRSDGDHIYSQGIHRDFLRDNRFDYAWPQFAAIGEQAVESRELWYEGAGADLDVFGYVPRYDEYRHKPSMATGAMRPGHSITLAQYHLGMDFASRPALNTDFLEVDPPVSRVTKITTEQDIRFDAWFDYKCARALPTFGVPGLRRL